MSSIRVVIAKPGLDGHDRGAKVVARALRDAGVEVIYTGLHQTPEQIVAAALQEDADAIGLSVLSGAHMTQFRRVLELLAERDADDIVVFGGGIIPDADIAELKQMGVAKIFTPGAATTEIVDWVRSILPPPPPAGHGEAGDRRRTVAFLALGPMWAWAAGFGLDFSCFRGPRLARGPTVDRTHGVPRPRPGRFAADHPRVSAAPGSRARSWPRAAAAYAPSPRGSGAIPANRPRPRPRRPATRHRPSRRTRAARIRALNSCRRQPAADEQVAELCLGHRPDALRGFRDGLPQQRGITPRARRHLVGQQEDRQWPDCTAPPTTARTSRRLVRARAVSATARAGTPRDPGVIVEEHLACAPARQTRTKPACSAPPAASINPVISSAAAPDAAMRQDPPPP